MGRRWQEHRCLGTISDATINVFRSAPGVGTMELTRSTMNMSATYATLKRGTIFTFTVTTYAKTRSYNMMSTFILFNDSTCNKREYLGAFARILCSAYKDEFGMASTFVYYGQASLFLLFIFRCCLKLNLSPIPTFCPVLSLIR